MEKKYLQFSERDVHRMLGKGQSMWTEGGDRDIRDVLGGAGTGKGRHGLLHNT